MGGREGEELIVEAVVALDALKGGAVPARRLPFTRAEASHGPAEDEPEDRIDDHSCARLSHGA